jgi:hypothetical protein
LKKKILIASNAFFLLVTYLLINGPSFLLHHHNNRIVSFEEANPCERAVFYEAKDGSCTHPVHVSKTIEKCKLCETHTATPHLLTETHFEVIPIGFKIAVNPRVVSSTILPTTFMPIKARPLFHP